MKPAADLHVVSSATWEFPKSGAPIWTPNGGALIKRTPTQRTPNFSKQPFEANGIMIGFQTDPGYEDTGRRVLVLAL